MPEVWPFLPTREIVERLTWETDVLRTPTREVRSSLRPARQELQMNFPHDNATWSRMQHLYGTAPLSDWLVPVWTQASRVTVASGDTSITCETAADYVAGGQAIVWRTCDSYSVVDVAAVGDGNITLESAVGANYPTALCMPLRTAYMAGMDASRMTREHSGWSATFHIRDAPDLYSPLVDGVANAATIPNFPFYGSDFAAPCAIGVGGESGRIHQPVVHVDNGYGLVALEPARDVLEGTLTASFAFAGLENIQSFRTFLHALRGKDRPFWVSELGGFIKRVSYVEGPTVSRFLQLNFLAEPDDYVGRHLMFNQSAMSEITSATLEADGTHTVNFSPIPVEVGDPARFITRVRLDADVVEIKHIRGLSAECKVMARSVPE